MNDIKNLILNHAESLFFEKLYNETSLQEIANKFNIKPSSLYYHFPGGKEEIYIEVLKNRLEKYKIQIQSLYEKSNEIKLFLEEFAEWYVSQPPMNMDLIVKIDMPHLTAKGKADLMGLISQSIFQPLQKVFENEREKIKHLESAKLVGLYLNLLNGITLALNQKFTQKDNLIKEYIDILMNGISKK